jgi:hypothetical protein
MDRLIICFGRLGGFSTLIWVPLIMVPDTQQNCVVERKNRILVEMARTMLDEHRTPRRYRAKAINTVCHVSNRILF